MRREQQEFAKLQFQKKINIYNCIFKKGNEKPHFWQKCIFKLAVGKLAKVAEPSNKSVP